MSVCVCATRGGEGRFIEVLREKREKENSEIYVKIYKDINREEQKKKTRKI